MLISFTFENWRSFRDTNTLNLVATAEKHHSERVPRINDHKLRILPTVAIYGGNASGKSNFFKALRFAQWMVTKGASVGKSISLNPFRPDGLQKPSCFGFVFSIRDNDNRDQIYDYSFALSKTKVLTEKLVWVKKNSEIVLFERQDGKTSDFHKTIEQDIVLHAVLKSTRENQLFLTNATSQDTRQYNTKQLLQVFDWFAKLVLIAPDAVCPDIMLEPSSDLIGTTLALLGTGIEKLKLEKIDFDGKYFPQGMIDDEMKTRLLAGVEKFVAHSNLGDRYIVSEENGELVAQKLVSVHQGGTIFDLKDDSDGTIRVIDLLPCFLSASKQNSERTYVIDELDRSLHTLLLRGLLESYLASCSPESRSQIIFTTHDVLQMDQNLLRRDEMWVTDRKNDGTTELVPFSAFKEIRKDKSIRTSYLRGQLGGTPKLLLHGAFPQEIDKED